MKIKVIMIAAVAVTALSSTQVFAWGWGDYVGRVIVEETVKQGVAAAVNNAANPQNDNQDNNQSSSNDNPNNNQKSSNNNNSGFQH